ncbi:ATP-binding cassette domain-containing protein [Methylocaldum szegediense]|uniref:Aliphatic sulfonate ABC transporter ATP binding subunit n=1 Tax=Methylocaldum szegediense TaxID=73780 RepID=A0ABN8X5U8_9GAMM|nr:ATP-binding cassette domain-containing protein [Methylocaldum szegediense]CAI8897002.1 aliphatic sulfonate ABC transporter ATP binding subunit [Methylocaldum szegediense]
MTWNPVSLVPMVTSSGRRSGLRLEVERVRKAFGAMEVLKELSLTIESGEFVAVVGRSGCGKSTLLRLIAGLERPDGGDIRVSGRSDAKPNGDIRVMFQEARLLPWRKVLDNVGVGLVGAWRERAHQALRQVGLAQRADDWPAALSGGQRQRVALARALVSRPRLLLFDEPLGALDALTRIEMQRLIESIWLEERFTALLVTHDVAEAVTLADRIVMLEHGRVSADIPVPLPRPRERGDSAFATLEGDVLRRILGREPVEAAANRQQPVRLVSAT